MRQDHGGHEEVQTENFFVVTGIDAAGKSTLLKRLTELRPDWSVGSYEPDCWLPQADLPQFEWARNRHPRDVVHQLEPFSRASFFLHMIFCHWEYWIKPRLLDGRVVVIDSFYYRFYAKEKIRGLAPDFFYQALDRLPDPHTVVFADVTPEIAARRRSQFDVYEVDGTADVDGFHRFQKELTKGLIALCGDRCKRLCRIDAASTPERVAAELLETIEARLRVE